MDGVVADAEVSCCVVVGDGFCSGCVGLGGGFPVQCAVGSSGVVVVGEFVELVLEFGQVVRSWSCGEPAFECLGLTRVWLTGSFSFLRPQLRPVLGFFQIRWA